MKYSSKTRSSLANEATLILLHGLGSDEQDMFGLAEMINERVEVICLRAPHQYGPGFAWFDIQWTSRGIQVDEKEYWNAVDELGDTLVALGKSNLVVGGFSQGAMMALGLITKFPQLATNCVLLSGRGIKDPCPAFMGNIFQGHGRFDDVIVISEARNLHSKLHGLGNRYEYHEYNMGHSINDEEVSDLNNWLRRVLDLK